MRPPKFDFIPERQLIKESKPVDPMFKASIYPNGALSFNKDYIEIYELGNKFIRIYADTAKRSIGWKILEGKTDLEEVDDSRKMVLTPQNSIKLSITGILSILGWTKGESYKKLPIEIYKSDGIEIHYIKLPDIEHRI